MLLGSFFNLPTWAVDKDEDNDEHVCSFPRAIESAPTEILSHVMGFLDQASLGQAAQVSRYWKEVSESNAVWQPFWASLKGGSIFIKQTGSHHTLKEKVKLHSLCVHVNIQDDLNRVRAIINKHKLTSFFGNKLGDLLFRDPSHLLIETFLAQDNEKARLWKFMGLVFGLYGYPKDLKAAIDFNDGLATLGNQEALERRFEGFAFGVYGYPKDLKSAVACNEVLVAFGNEKAMVRKAVGSAYGRHGYPKDLEMAVRLNDELAALVNLEAMMRKFKDPKDIFTFNEYLVAQGNEKARERKAEGLAEGLYGYPKAPEVAVAFNEKLINLGNEKARERKYEGLIFGRYGYSLNLNAALIFNDNLVAQGSLNASIQKFKGLLIGQHPYPREYSLHSFINELIQLGNPLGFYLYALGLKHGLFGIKQDVEEAKRVILDYGIPY